MEMVRYDAHSLDQAARALAHVPDRREVNLDHHRVDHQPDEDGDDEVDVGEFQCGHRLEQARRLAGVAQVRLADSRFNADELQALGHRDVQVLPYVVDHDLAGRPELVVVGNAVPRTNPEAVELERLGLAFCSMPQAVNR